MFGSRRRALTGLWTARRHVAPIACLMVVLGGCGEGVQEPAGQRTGAASLNRQDLLLPAVLAAVASGDTGTLDVQLKARWARQQRVRLISGARSGVRGAQTLALTRGAPGEDAIVFWSAEETPIQIELHPADGGAAQAIEAAVAPAPEGGTWHTITHDQLTTQGALLAGPEGVSLADAGDGVLVLPIFEATWGGATVTPLCAPGDYACLLSAHADFILEDMQIARQAEQGASAARQIASYVSKHNAYGEVVATRGAGDLDVVVTFAGAATSAAKVYLVSPGGARQLAPYAQLVALKGGKLQATFTLPKNTARDALIVVDGAPSEAPSLSKLAVTEIPDVVQALNWPWEQRVDWSVSGCLTFQDDRTVAPAIDRPLANVEVRLRGARYFGVYATWATGRTNANGCFVLTAQHSDAPRDLRVDVRFEDNQLAVRNVWNAQALLNSWFFNVRQVNGQGAGALNWGTMRFAPNEPGELGQAFRQDQAVFWFTGHQLDAELRAQDPWFGFNQAWTISYPDPILTLAGAGLALGFARPTLYATEDATMGLMLHEMGHIWFYMHQSGANWNTFVDFVNGFDTHNCQESRNTAFLEGFADFFSEHARCSPDLWFTGLCGNNLTRPFRSQQLFDLDACDGAQAPDTIARFERNDTAVLQALNLLVVDDFYRLELTAPFTGRAQWSSVTLDPACEWFTFNQLDLFDVLDTFRGRPNHPNADYRQHFSTSPGTGIDAFTSRFVALRGLPAGYERDRRRFWDINLTADPSTFCSQSCQEPTSWWDGSDPAGAFDGANCAVMPMPTGGFVTGNAYYEPPQQTCPWGTLDSTGCFIHSAAPNTTPFVYDGNLYTTPLQVESCPIGQMNTSGALPCHAGYFTWFGMPISPGNVYTSNGHLMVQTSSSQCAAWGGVLAGQNLCDLGDLQGQSYMVHFGHINVGATQTPTCPAGSLDPVNCYLGTPAPGTTGFTAGHDLYTTPLTSCPRGVLDANGCRLGTPPVGRQAFVFGGLFYFTSS